MSSAVLLCVPEVEPVVVAWRARGEPDPLDVPAHVSLLPAFPPGQQVDDATAAELVRERAVPGPTGTT